MMHEGGRTAEVQVSRRLYDWTLEMAGTRAALWMLAAVSFAESSVFPIPNEIMMIPMVIARPDRWILIALVTTVFSVLGGVAGYAIGAFAFDQIGQPVLAALGKAEAMAEFNAQFNDFGFWPVLIAGITPFPYKVITIMSGWTGLPFSTFVITSVIARGIRFGVTCWLLYRFGAPIRGLIERRMGLMSVLFVAILLGGFYLVRFL